MGAVQSTQLDLRQDPSSMINDPRILESAKAQADEAVRNGVDANKIGQKQLRGTGLLVVLNLLKNILGNALPGPTPGRRLIIEVQDDSVGSLFVNINGVWKYMFMINGKDHQYNNFPIRVNTELQFLFLVNDLAIRWNYKTYNFAQTIIHIDKSYKRGFYCSVYGQSILGYDDYTFHEDDDRIVKGGNYPATRTAIFQLQSEPASKYTYDWSINSNTIVTIKR
ncbi:hypothetical protein CYY_005104 [Polysphondylium violaceum]|uniref:Uncharacterized protein n=1 Tax=Polysphondylium violaceum TaxID=133409 RepID=A0A8J4PVE7_9MYCE|nr:hypothetical protein CYY_005104 [Polysphondylium violaceum]